MANESIFEYAGRFVLRRGEMRKLEKSLAASGVDLPAEAFTGYAAVNVLVMSFFLSLVIMLHAPFAEAISSTLGSLLGMELPGIAIWVLVLAVLLVLVYFATSVLISSYLIMRAESRRTKLEATLPDFLTLVASNIKAGMTLDQAMWYSAKPEFGLLSEEVRAVIKGSFSGESMELSLDKLSKRFDSRVFTRTVMLLKQTTASGGELTEVLERTAEDVRNTIIMKKEIAASLIMYEIFVLFASAAGTPFLFAVASKLIEVFEKIAPYMPSGGMSGMPAGGMSGFMLGSPVISSGDFMYFVIPTIFVTALVSSFIVSVIRSGTKSQGLKYFPFVLLVSYIVYWLTDSFLKSFFGMFA